jgi:hypothetical protein
VKLEIKRIFDDKEFSVWQVGLWQHTVTSDGEAFWNWTGESSKAIAEGLRIAAGASRGPAQREVAEDLHKAPDNGVSRFAKMSRVPSVARVAKAHVWEVFKPDKAS